MFRVFGINQDKKIQLSILEDKNTHCHNMYRSFYSGIFILLYLAAVLSIKYLQVGFDMPHIPCGITLESL